jgi:hypothetical protein
MEVGNEEQRLEGRFGGPSAAAGASAQDKGFLEGRFRDGGCLASLAKDDVLPAAAASLRKAQDDEAEAEAWYSWRDLTPRGFDLRERMAWTVAWAAARVVMTGTRW